MGMIRGLRMGLVLVAGVLLYVTAFHVAGMAVLYPAARTVCVVTKPAAEEVTFPIDLPGTPLQIEKTVFYEGPFLEDGEDELVVGVMALLVRNTGAQSLETAQITLVDERATYRFQGHHIPPHSRVLLLETGGAPFKQTGFLTARGYATEEEADLLQTGEVEIEDVSMGSVTVTNRTDRTLYDLRLYYKNYLSDGDLYQGGICYETRIETLAAGQSVTLNPQHYAMGYSRFVWAQEA